MEIKKLPCFIHADIFKVKNLVKSQPAMTIFRV